MVGSPSKSIMRNGTSSFGMPIGFSKTINQVVTAGNEIRAYGTWSCIYQERTSAPRYEEGHFVWIMVREGDFWKVRKDTSSESNFHSTN
jgi:hypothetical protein